MAMTRSFKIGDEIPPLTKTMTLDGQSVEVGVRIEQRLDEGYAARADRDVERAVLFRSGGVRVGAGVQESAHHGGAGILAGVPQRRGAQVVRGVHTEEVPIALLRQSDFRRGRRDDDDREVLVDVHRGRGLARCCPQHAIPGARS